MENKAVTRKKREVEQLIEKLKRAVSFYIVDYTGLNANAMNTLRGKFRSGNFDYFVIKNTILKRAGENLELKRIEDVLIGPNAISISYKDPVGPAKIIHEFYKENEHPTVKLCYIEGKWFSAEEVKQIAILPSREILISRVVNLLSSPLYQCVNLLHSLFSRFVLVLDAIRETKEKGKETEKLTEETEELARESMMKEEKKDERKREELGAKTEGKTEEKQEEKKLIQPEEHEGEAREIDKPEEKENNTQEEPKQTEEENK